MAQKFFFVFGNHGQAPAQLEDFYELVRDLISYTTGQKLHVSKEPVPGHWNILVENFSEEFAEILMRTKRMDKSTRFICLVTEFMTGNTFNLFPSTYEREIAPILTAKFFSETVRGSIERACPQPLRDTLSEVMPAAYEPTRDLYFRLLGRPPRTADTHYADLKYWRERYRNFMTLVPRFDAVWCISPSQMPGYTEAVDDEKLWLLPILPYTDSVAKEALTPESKDIDILFTGTVTSYRGRFLQELESKGYKVVTGPSILPEHIRHDYLERTKVCVHLKPSADWKYSSNMRLHTLLMASKFVVAEKSEDEVVQTRFVREVPSEAFVDDCIESLSKLDFVGMGRSAKEAYVNETREDRKRVKRELNEFFAH